MLQKGFGGTKDCLLENKNIVAEMNNSLVGLEAKVDKICKEVEHKDKGRGNGREK